jgi:hypothetical protein
MTSSIGARAGRELFIPTSAGKLSAARRAIRSMVDRKQYVITD